MKRILAIDYGSKRIGVAISDPLGITARGLETINNREKDLLPACDRLIELLVANKIDNLVVGLPKRTDGLQSQTEIKVYEFVNLLKYRYKGELNIEFVDERFTSTIANNILKQSSKKGAKEKRNVVDQLAAEIILQDYLEKIRKILD